MGLWLRFIGTIAFLFLAVDAVMRVVGTVSRYEALRRAQPSVGYPGNELWGQWLGIAGAEVLLGLIVVSLCWGLAQVIDRLPEK